MSTYSEEMTARREKLRTVVQAIADQLPAWQMEVHDDVRDSVELVHRDGARVNLSIVTYGSDEGRLRATMSIPGFYKGDSREQVDAAYKERDIYCRVDAYKYPRVKRDRFRITVTVSADRPANVLAKDLDRRLLSPAIDYHIEAMAALAEHRDQIDHREATIERIIAAHESGVRKYGQDGVSFGDYNHATVDTNGTVRFTELRCSVEDAIAIINLLTNKGA